MTRLVLVASLLVSVALATAAQAAERLFPESGSGLLHGGVTAIGGSNSGYLIAVQDVDGNAATTDSSSEVLTLPAGATIRSATLIWNQDCIEPCTLSGPNAINPSSAASTRAVVVSPSAVTTVVAQRVTTYAGHASSFDISGRVAWADVTALLTAQYVSGGRIAVGNISPTFSGGGLYRNTTWSIFIVYEDASAPLRAVAVDLEAAPLPTTSLLTEITLSIAGVQLPTSAVTGTVVVHAADGQASIAGGENLYIDTKTTAQALFNTANPLNNLWNHSISYLGVASTTARPDPRSFDGGAAGIDLDTFDIAGKPTPGANKVDLIVTTTANGQPNQEFVVILTAALAVDVKQPNLIVDKALSDAPAVTLPGDAVAFTLTLTNHGNDAAQAITLSDVFPAGTRWVPGSLALDGVPIGDDDVAVTLGDSSLALKIDALAIGASVDVTFALALDEATLGLALGNVATVGYGGLSTSETFSATSARVPFGVCGNGLVEAPEACDDGDGLDDACTNVCAVNAGPETCDDGLDDDGDGLVDGYDDDCQPATSCTTVAAPPGFSVRQDWASSFTMSAMLALVAGDLDGDGLPELVGGAPGVSDGDYTFDRLYVVSHAGTADVTRTELVLPAGARVSGGTSAAIGDLFVSRPGAEVAIFDTLGQVQVFAADGTLLATSPPVVTTLGARDEGDFASSLQLADLDQDGVPEIIVGNAVVRVVGDSLVVAIPLDRSQPRGNVPNGDIVAVADLLSVDDCQDAICAGLELAAGGTVYAFDLAAGERRVVRRLSAADATIGAGIDGSTALADMDLDGDLDVVFVDTAAGGVARDLYVWDPRSLTLIHRAPGAALNGASGACWGPGSPAQSRALAGSLAIAEVYDERVDGQAENLPEVMFTTVNAVRAYNIHAGRVWELSHSDCSAVTGITAFDFNGDGVREVVLNDEQRLRIIYGGPLPLPAGVSATRDWASFTSGTGTLTEQPIVVDVDGDGEAEIVSVTGASGAINGNLKVFGTAGLPWRAARAVWNQRHYHVTNIDDDLTVLAHPQSTLAELPPASGVHPLNLWGAQAPAIADLIVPPPRVAAADVVVVGVSVAADATTGVSTCPGALLVSVGLSNSGSAALPAGTALAFFDADPFTAATPRLLGTGTTEAAILAGASATVDVLLADPGITSPRWTLWVVANTSGAGPFPLVMVDGGVPECAAGSDNRGSVDVLCSVCGDGVVDGDEACDVADGNATSVCGCGADCTYPDATTACDDGLFCTTTASCSGDGVCVPGVRSDAGSPCASDALCDEAGDRCRRCGDGIVDAGESCDAGDANGTTTCGCTSGCMYGTGACDDGLFCTARASCDGLGLCSAGVRGDDNTPCGRDALCDEASDTCFGCVAASDCDDGTFCDGPEACVAHACVPGVAPCVAARCDEAGDTCAAPRCGDHIVDDGEACDDELGGCDARCRVTCVAGVDCYCDLNPDDVVCGRCEEGGCYCDLRPDAEGCVGCEGACLCDDAAELGTPSCPSCVAGVDCACDRDPTSAACTAPCVGACACVVGATCFCDLHPTVPGCRACQVGVDCACDVADNQLTPACDPRCTGDDDCDDGLFCDGAETCERGACVAGTSPCGEGEACDDEGDACVPPVAEPEPAIEVVESVELEPEPMPEDVEVVEVVEVEAEPEPTVETTPEVVVEPAPEEVVEVVESVEPAPESDAGFIVQGGGGCAGGGEPAWLALAGLVLLSRARRAARLRARPSRS